MECTLLCGYRTMRVLIGCEESQAVCKAFRALGHEAYSNDLKDCSGGHPEWHLKMDVFEAVDSRDWDFIGLHPVCTKMTLSGNAHYGVGKPKHQERLDAVEWTIGLWEYAVSRCDRVYMENPLGAMNGDVRLPKPQIIQPYYFGDPHRKPTCLWLHGLRPLFWAKQDDLFAKKTSVEPDIVVMTSKKTGRTRSYSSWEYEASCDQENRKEIRSKTFPGIARAMAEQWGGVL